jgi:hypothetical protein
MEANPSSRVPNEALSSILGCMDLAALATNDNDAVSLAATLTLAATLPAAVILCRAFSALKETTLIVPWSWACISGAGIVLSALYGATTSADAPGSSFAAWQFVAACGTFCPFVALIGAKRPQHSAWSFVVLSLWGMLSLPAAEVLLLQPGQQLEINAFRSWFLCAIMAAEIINFLLTRFGWAVLLLVAGQTVWLSEYLPLTPHLWLPAGLAAHRVTLGFLLVASSLVGAWLATLRRPPKLGSYDRLWIDFRDAFGLFWALRLSERVNAVATQANWGFDLGWSGFRTTDELKPLGELPAEIDRPLQHNLQGLLRRFVSPEWIAQRLNADSSSAKRDSP